jgi:hypothetical protein
LSVSAGPLYGWLRRNRSDQRLQAALDTALLEAVEKDEELPAILLLWAGADPLRKVPEIGGCGDPSAWDEEYLTSGAEVAIEWGGIRCWTSSASRRCL